MNILIQIMLIKTPDNGALFKNTNDEEKDNLFDINAHFTSNWSISDWAC